MRLKFICDNHLQWLETRPEETKAAWRHAQETGARYQDLRMWQESIKPLGCAFELATLMMQQSASLCSETTEQFSDAAKRLVFSLTQIRENDAALMTIDGVKVFCSSHRQLVNQQDAWALIRILHVLLVGGLEETNALRSNTAARVAPINTQLNLH